jgi:uncharacterized protein (UPF0333 family)
MIKGQTALEYLIIVTVLLAALLPLVYLANQYSSRSTVSVEAKVAVDSLVESADYVTSLSPGSKTTVDIFIPQGYVSNESSINGKRILLTFYLSTGKKFTIHKETKANVTGTLPSGWGYHEFSFTFQEDATVLIEAAA